ncbi:hypothetical protein D3C87_1920440 [compost metagenome]
MVGSVVAPVTPAEVEAARDHLTSDAEARAWGRRGWDRAALTRDACNLPSGALLRPGGASDVNTLVDKINHEVAPTQP